MVKPNDALSVIRKLETLVRMTLQSGGSKQATLTEESVDTYHLKTWTISTPTNGVC